MEATTVTPAGPYARQNGEGKTLTAKLQRSQGSWWLYWEDGKRQTLDKSCAPSENHGYPQEDIVQLVCG